MSQSGWVLAGILLLTGLAVSAPLVAIVLTNRQPQERPARLEDIYPDEHLGI